MTDENALLRDANGNVWKRTPAGYDLVDTSGDLRPSHEFWHPGRGETKRGERSPVAPLTPVSHEEEPTR
jgi:hypothetical protein